MQIQTQATPAVAALGGSGLANSGQGARAKGASGGFATTLNGMLFASVDQDASRSESAPGSLNSLIKLLMPLLSVSHSDAKDQTPEEAVKQLDDLIQMLNQSEDETENNILDNPVLQAWLVNLQSMMPNNYNARSGSLFEPISPDSITSANGTEASNLLPLKQQGITKTDALQLLNDFKNMLQSSGSDMLQLKPMKELPIVMSVLQAASSTANARTEAKPETQLQLGSNIDFIASNMNVHNSTLAHKKAHHNTGDANIGNTVKAAENQNVAIQVVPSAQQRLSALTAKSAAIGASIEKTDSQASLFEPLTPADLADVNLNSLSSQAVPLNEFLKQAQSGGQMPKVPVLQMPAEAFASETAQFIVSSFSLQTTSDGFSEAKISLFPQHLGQVDVKLTMHNGQLVAQFMADSVSGKEALESQLAQLRTTLQNQGIQVERLEVTQGQGFQSGMFQEHRQQQSQQFTGKQQKSGNTRVSAIDALDDELTAEVTESPAASGSKDSGSIDITA